MRSRLRRRDGWRSRGRIWSESQGHSEEKFELRRTEGSSDDFTGVDAADEDAAECVLGVKRIELTTFADFGVRGASCTSIVEEVGMTNRSDRK